MNLNLTHATRIGLSLIAFLGVSIMLHLGASVFIPLVLSILLASILYPGAKYLYQRIRIPWFFSCLTVLLAAVALFLVVTVAFAIAIPRTIEGFPRTEDEWQAQYRSVQRNLSVIIPYKIEHWMPPDPDQSNLFRLGKEFVTGSKVSDLAITIAQTAAAYIWQAILIMFITLFLLLEGQMLSDKMRAIFGPSRHTQDKVTKALAEIADGIRTYLVWRTIVNLGLAIVLGAVYNWVDLKYWYLWALLVAVLCYVPYLGTIAAGIPPVLDAMLFVDPMTAIFIGIFYTGVVTVEGYLLVPWVMGRSMDLNATTVLIACIFWELLWGLAGLFLAMPIMAAIKAVCMQVDGWQGWGDLMGSGPAKPLELDDTTEKTRLDAIARGAGNGDGTVVMESLQGDHPVKGDPKSDTF